MCVFAEILRKHVSWLLRMQAVNTVCIGLQREHKMSRMYKEYPSLGTLPVLYGNYIFQELAQEVLINSYSCEQRNIVTLSFI